MRTTILKAMLLGVSLFTSASLVGAESLMAHIPFDFTAGAKTMPAGDYQFSVDTTGVLMVRGTGPAAASAIIAALADAGATASPSAVFEKSLRGAALAKVTLPSGIAYSLPGFRPGGKLMPLTDSTVLLSRH
jgi:hypothetical protein